MKSFLIGSLPYKSIEQAIEHVFSFDIPTLPNLPQIEPNEFMVDQALSCIDGYIYKGSSLREKIGQRHEGLSFCATDEFFKRLNECYKWQACGPLTLASSLDHHPDTSKIISIYLEKILDTQNHFNSLSTNKEFIFFLDEPVLAFCETEISTLNEFISKLKTSKQFSHAKIGVHACSRVSLEALELLDVDYVALDPSLYGAEISDIQESLGERLVFIPVSSKGEAINYEVKSEKLVAPSCGGALSSPDEMEQLKKLLLEATLPNHQD
ncbi:MAG: hypothetical protein KC478_09710 [Bacteriovoracaceae bacterium]|nr:hypothetical protein [Bacteriovoracaceae bacterium]